MEGIVNEGESTRLLIYCYFVDIKGDLCTLFFT